jgi:hypothetical protein
MRVSEEAQEDLKLNSAPSDGDVNPAPSEYEGTLLDVYDR